VEQFAFDGRECGERTLASVVVVGPFDPDHDGQGQLVSGAPGAA
jgi:hypothetical protein